VAQPPSNTTAVAKNASGAATPAGPTQPVAGAGAGGASDSISKQTTRNYEIDRTLAYTRQPAGKLKRLTVAVLIDNMRSVDKDGKAKEIPLTPQQLEHVNQLVKDAVGFDEARGDNVNVVNASFTAEASVPEGDLQTPAFWESPLFLSIAKVVAGLVVLLVLVLSVLRPMMRSLVGPARAVQLMPRTAEPLASNAPALAAATAKEVAVTHDQQVAQARTLVNQDPKRVAQVVRGWVAADE
jgi:flagellar M-ring protein FliF